MRIKIEDEIPDVIAIKCVAKVVEAGKISHDSKGKPYYTWATRFVTSVGQVIVYTQQYRKDDCFRVYKARLQ